MFAHLIFRTDISLGADCASKQQRGCKWGGAGGTSNRGGGAIRKGGCIENTNTGLFILADI